MSIVIVTNNNNMMARQYFFKDRSSIYLQHNIKGNNIKLNINKNVCLLILGDI